MIFCTFIMLQRSIRSLPGPAGRVGAARPATAAAATPCSRVGGSRTAADLVRSSGLVPRAGASGGAACTDPDFLSGPWLEALQDVQFDGGSSSASTRQLPAA